MIPTKGKSISTVTQARDLTGLRFSDNTMQIIDTVVTA
jgi:hypothetical protein